MSKKNFTDLKSAFDQFLKAENLEQQFLEKKLIMLWPDMMGNLIANRTTGLRVKDRVLFVQVSSAPLRQEMRLHKDKMMETIATHLGVKIIDDIKVN